MASHGQHRRMESRSGRLGFAKSRDNLVPFPGMGTRLRRSRSREHSAERDNLSTDLEISHLRQSRGTGAHLLQGGTLERPKRLFYPAAESDTSSLAHQPSLYGLCRATKAPLYEQSRLGHQYEEPHLVLDCLGIKGKPVSSMAILTVAFARCAVLREQHPGASVPRGPKPTVQAGPRGECPAQLTRGAGQAGQSLQAEHHRDPSQQTLRQNTDCHNVT